MLKQCNTCKVGKPPGAFNVRQAKCKECQKAYNEHKYQEHKSASGSVQTEKRVYEWLNDQAIDEAKEQLMQINGSIEEDIEKSNTIETKIDETKEQLMQISGSIERVLEKSKAIETKIEQNIEKSKAIETKIEQDIEKSKTIETKIDTLHSRCKLLACSIIVIGIFERLIKV